MPKHLNKSELVNEIHDRQGLIPVSINAEAGKVFWLDFGKYHFYEGFFHKSINFFSALKNNEIYEISSDLEVFEDKDVLTSSIYPNGFIFHAGRSGSTLLAKTFARSRKNLVLSEVAAHNQFWLAATGNGARQLTIGSKIQRNIYKNLILATARHRLDSHQFCVIKFTSYNILFYNFIRSVFPDIPMLFLYREPSEILSSQRKKPPGWIDGQSSKIRKLLTNIIGSEIGTLTLDEYQHKILGEYFSVALDADKKSLKCINYNELKEEIFASLCRNFNMNFDIEELNLMKTQFSFYSKSERKKVVFSIKPVEKEIEFDNFPQDNFARQTHNLYTKLEHLFSSENKNSGAP